MTDANRRRRFVVSFFQAHQNIQIVEWSTDIRDAPMMASDTWNKYEAGDTTIRYADGAEIVLSPWELARVKRMGLLS